MWFTFPDFGVWSPLMHLASISFVTAVPVQYLHNDSSFHSLGRESLASKCSLFTSWHQNGSSAVEKTFNLRHCPCHFETKLHSLCFFFPNASFPFHAVSKHCELVEYLALTQATCLWTHSFSLYSLFTALFPHWGILFNKTKSRCFHWSLSITGKLFSLPHLFLIVLGTTSAAIIEKLA